MSTGWPDRLVGEWKGTGFAAFPTIDTVEYTEHLRFEACPGDPVVHYEQRTVIVSPEARAGDPLHWESGFLEATENGGVQLLNSQNSGRVEVLIGTAETGSDGSTVITLNSIGIYNDPRMVSSRRRLEVATDRLFYEMWMATTNVEMTTPHLRAELRRTS